MSYQQERRLETLERILNCRRLSDKEQKEYNKLCEMWELEHEEQYI